MGSDDRKKLVGLYESPSLKFCLPVFMNFSSCFKTFSTFAIVHCNYDENLTWKIFRVDLISRSA